MYHIYSDYDNYRWINFNRWSVAREADELAKYFVTGMNVKKASGYRMNMKVLVMDLYQSYLCDPEQYIAYHRGKDHYAPDIVSDKDKRYIKNPHISYTCLIGCIDHLDKVYIENAPGGYFYNEDSGSYFGYVSRMRATKELADLWKHYNFNPDMICKFKPDDVVILKGKEREKTYEYKGEKKTKLVKDVIGYKDNRKTMRMRKVVEHYNNLIERTHIDVDVECLSHQDRRKLVNKLSNMQMKDKRIVLRLSDKEVYRVFNNESFELGGRFYGAWWIGCPSIIRKYIYINGRPTIELDYSGIHVHLLYALKGINYADRNEDPYILDDGIPDRKLNKLILLTAFNAKNAYDTASAVFDEIRDEGHLIHYNLHSFDQIYTKLELLKKKHEPIADQIANNYSLKLQYYDSCIIENLIKNFTKYEIPILTIHDSIVCQDIYADIVKDKMWQLYSNTIDEMLNYKIEYNSFTPQAKWLFKLKNTFSKYYKGIKASYLIKTIQNKEWNSRYQCNIPHQDNSIIAIKQEQRSNKCTGNCNFGKRLARRINNIKNVVLKLEEHRDSYTNILVIR